MIEYKFNEEHEYLLHNATKLKDDKALNIIKQGTVKNPDEALYLSEYFWRMADSSIEDEKSGVDLPWPEGAEF